jgi:predicted PurR-regulated permease PerM
VRQINLIFGGFMTGNVLDALLVGVVCFLGLTVLRIPYALVIGVLVGITNLIPVFGPFLGAVPSAFLLLLADPAKCLIFIIFIVVLQQIDGNIVSPVILGGSTGLPAFWVLFSLLLFGHIMGVWGLILGVPLFAALYYLLKQGVNYLLTRRNLPIRTDSYVKVDKIDADGKAIYLEERERSFFLKKEARRKSEREALATILERGGDVNPDPKPDTETKGFKR